MKNILILDTETTDTDPKTGELIEVGAVLWNVQHRCIVDCWSTIITAESNKAELINGIPAELLSFYPASTRELAISRACDMAGDADLIIAHYAEFDRQWLPELSEKLWVCSMEDVTWPKPSASKSLISIALTHGVSVVSAHRAIHDCLLMARLFEAVEDIGARLESAAEHALLPKAEIISLAPFEQKDIVKAHGFHWDAGRKVWHRTMAIKDTEALPFRTRIK